MSNAGNGSALEAQHAAEHDDDHGHGHDPNEGVVVGTPPTPAWVLAASAIGLVTAIAAVLLAIAMRDVGGSPTDSGDHGLRAALVATVVG